MLNYLAAASAALSAATAAILAYPGDLVDAQVILVMVVVNAALGAFVAKLIPASPPEA